MAQLRDTVISGSLRATDSLLSTTAQFKILNVPTSNGGTTYGPGTAGNILFSGGSTNGAYWGATTGITSVGTITSGTWSATAIAANKGGTGQTGYTVGDTLYCGTANTLSKLGGNTTTTRKFLRSVAATAGTATAPAWDTITSNDLPLEYLGADWGTLNIADLKTMIQTKTKTLLATTNSYICLVKFILTIGEFDTDTRQLQIYNDETLEYTGILSINQVINGSTITSGTGTLIFWSGAPIITSANFKYNDEWEKNSYCIKYQYESAFPASKQDQWILSNLSNPWKMNGYFTIEPSDWYVLQNTNSYGENGWYKVSLSGFDRIKDPFGFEYSTPIIVQIHDIGGTPSTYPEELEAAANAKMHTSIISDTNDNNKTKFKIACYGTIPTIPLHMEIISLG